MLFGFGRSPFKAPHVLTASFAPQKIPSSVTILLAFVIHPV